MTERSEHMDSNDRHSMGSGASAPRLCDVVRALERLYPLQYAESWDHPGLIVGDPADTVSTIAFAVDPTMEVIDDAIAAGADLLVCHHPLFFRAVHEVSGLGVHGAIVGKLYRAHCALWVGHTNADVAFRGVAQAAADAFGLHHQAPLVSQGEVNGHEIGLGRVGELAEPMSLRDFAGIVAETLPQTPYGIQIAGDVDAPIRRVAVLPGSGDSDFDEARGSGADVYVTSDLRHHPATDALQQARHEVSLRSVGIPSGCVPAAADGSGTVQASDSALRPALINTPHSAIESLWFRYALDDVADAVASDTGFRPTTMQLTDITDPWQLIIPGTAETAR